jgi:hypothetical protein
MNNKKLITILAALIMAISLSYSEYYINDEKLITNYDSFDHHILALSALNALKNG